MGVNFPGGRFITQVYHCSPSRLLTIGLFMRSPCLQEVLAAIGGMQLEETLVSLVYSIVKQTPLQNKKKMYISMFVILLKFCHKFSLSIVNSLRSACATVAPFNLCIILTRKRVWSRSGADKFKNHRF